MPLASQTWLQAHGGSRARLGLISHNKAKPHTPHCYRFLAPQSRSMSRYFFRRIETWSLKRTGSSLI